MKAWVPNSENISLSLLYQGLSVVTVSCPTPAYNSTYCTLISGRILADRVTLQVDISLTKGYLAVWDVAVSGTSETPGEHFKFYFSQTPQYHCLAPNTGANFKLT